MTLRVIARCWVAVCVETAPQTQSLTECGVLTQLTDAGALQYGMGAHWGVKEQHCQW